VRGSAPRGVLVDPRVCKCIHVFKIRRMSGVQRGRSRGGRNANRVGREGTREVPRGPPGRNRMTERAR